MNNSPKIFFYLNNGKKFNFSIEYTVLIYNTLYKIFNNKIPETIKSIKFDLIGGKYYEFSIENSYEIYNKLKQLYIHVYTNVDETKLDIIPKIRGNCNIFFDGRKQF